MTIMGNGLDFSGNALFKPMDESSVAEALVAAFTPNAESVRSLALTTTQADVFKSDMRRVTPDRGDPRAVGWTFLINSADPQRDDIQQILEPLAMHRGMADPKEPLLYNGEPPDEWFYWLQKTYYALGLEGKRAPQYILIVGGPDQVPFRFQSILDTGASVGRIVFDTLDDLNQYVEKLIRIENAADPLVTKEAVFFAPDHGDATYYSRKYMAEPLAKLTQDEMGFTTRTIFGDDATKANLMAAISTGTPALVYTASHGLGAFDQATDFQKRYNGAVCCQDTRQGTDSLFSADDVPLDQPFLEGSVFFQFACFGYGTPAESDFAHWLPNQVPKKYADADFLAALPKKLLAHPKGPIAFIGHLDIALLHGFAVKADLSEMDRWHARIVPFKTAVNQLLSVQPSGLAMEDLNKRYSDCNALIKNLDDCEKRGKLTWTPKLKANFLDTWLSGADAQNYLIFGDPAGRLRISE